MEIDLTHGEVGLSEGRPIRMLRANGVTIHCIVGTIWITTEGLAQDVFLTSGQRHRIAGNKLTLVESIGEGCVRIALPQAVGPLRRRFEQWVGGGVAPAKRRATA